MPIQNYQYMERLAEISKQYEKDEGLPAACRQLFSKAFDLAGHYKYSPGNTDGNTLDETFSVLCDACKSAGLHRCKENQRGFLSCQLVWNYPSQ